MHNLKSISVSNEDLNMFINFVQEYLDLQFSKSHFYFET